MRRLFADSAYWIGLRDKTDPFHTRSRKIAKWIVQNRYALVVTPFIFAESHAYFCRIPEIREMVIRDFWENPLVTIEQPSYQDQTQAVGILREQRDKAYSFADALSFVIMMRLNIHEVATFDRHFQQFGQFTIIDGSSL
jgi:uncharacterized protein